MGESDLQRSFRAMAGAGSVEDLQGQMASLLRELSGDADISVVRRSSPGARWEVLGKNGRGALTVEPDLVHDLPDGSSVGVTKGGERNSVHLLLHLYQNVYDGLMRKRNEKELIFSLNHRVLQLTSLIDTGIEMARLDVGSLPHRLALERAAALTNASGGLVRMTVGDQLAEEVRFPSGENGREEARITHRIKSGFTYGDRTFLFELHDKESRAGVRPFEETDQLLLDALARQVHASLENRDLHRQALEKQRIEQDLTVAATIQQRILPASLPTIPGYDVAGVNIPSKSVGGDYYDCMRLPNGMVLLVIADVAGKGVPAALLVSSLHAYLSAYLETGVAIVELTKRLNRVIFNASTDDKFITAFFALLSPETGEVETVNAGHNPAYLVTTEGEVRELEAGGIALGMLDIDFPFQSEKFVMKKGERLLLYTDGIPEATNEKMELYESHSPLREIFLQKGRGSAADFIRELIDGIRQYTGSAPQSDDITALFLSRTT